MAFGQNPYYYPQGCAVPDQLAAYKQPYQMMPQQPYQMMPQQQTQPQGNGMIWVQGEAAAKSWAVAPGATVILWDSENPFIYIKSADPSGIPSMRTLRWEDYRPEAAQAQTPSGDYAPMGAVKALEDKLSALEARIEAMNKTEEG
jgi:hypothetical protein